MWLCCLDIDCLGLIKGGISITSQNLIYKTPSPELFWSEMTEVVTAITTERSILSSLSCGCALEIGSGFFVFFGDDGGPRNV